MPVKLRGYFGIHPTIIYFIKVLLIFLCIGFIPSFFTNSRRVYINTNIYPVNVSVDGKQLSMTPHNTRLSSGVHELLFSYAGRDLGRASMRVKNALFFSWFFEYRQNFSYTIEFDDNLLFLIEKNFLANAVQYSTLFYTDSTHTQPELFSHYKSLALSHAKNELITLASRFISNEAAAGDYRNSFDKSYGFEKIQGFVRDRRLSGVYSSAFTQLKIGGIDFIKVSDNIAITKDELISAENIKAAFEYAEGFSKKHGVRARLVKADEYKALVLSDKNKMFSDLTSGLYEYTSDVFLPDGSILDANGVETLTRYGIEPNYRLFCFSDINSHIKDSERLALVGSVGLRDTQLRCAFRLAVEL